MCINSFTIVISSSKRREIWGRHSCEVSRRPMIMYFPRVYEIYARRTKKLLSSAFRKRVYDFTFIRSKLEQFESYQNKVFVIIQTVFLKKASNLARGTNLKDVVAFFCCLPVFIIVYLPNLLKPFISNIF